MGCSQCSEPWFWMQNVVPFSWATGDKHYKTCLEVYLYASKHWLNNNQVNVAFSFFGSTEVCRMKTLKQFTLRIAIQERELLEWCFTWGYFYMAVWASCALCCFACHNLLWLSCVLRTEVLVEHFDWWSIGELKVQIFCLGREQTVLRDENWGLDFDWKN